MSLFSFLNNESLVPLTNALEAKADVNCRDMHGRTLLMVAISTGNPNVVEIIMRHAPDLTLKDKDDCTVLDYLESSANSLKLRPLILPVTSVEQNLRQALTDCHGQLAELKETVVKQAHLLGQRKMPESPKRRAFRDLIEEGLKEVYYVANAFVKGKAARPRDSLDLIIDGIKVVGPSATQQAGAVAAAASTALNLFGSLIQMMRDNSANLRAQHLVAELGTDADIADVAVLRQISTYLADRYADQIEQLSSSVPPRKSDDIFNLAKFIVARIAIHLMLDKNATYPKSCLSGKASKPMPLIQRCIRAIIEETNCKVEDMKAERIHFKGDRTDWNIEGVLTQTGLKLKKPDGFIKYYVFNDLLQKSSHELYGYCLSDGEEIIRRRFILDANQHVEKAILAHSTFPKHLAALSPKPLANVAPMFKSKSENQQPLLAEEQPSDTEDKIAHSCCAIL